MILIGQYDSSFVRRVGIALRLYDLPFEHRPWSVFGDADKVRALNPLGRVPILVLDGGEVLADSAAILDHLDEQAGTLEHREVLRDRGAAHVEARRDLAGRELALGDEREDGATARLGDGAERLVQRRVAAHDGSPACSGGGTVAGARIGGPREVGDP